MIRIETNKRYSWGHIDITVSHENTIINGSCVANDAEKQAHELLSAGVACLEYAGMPPEQISARVSQEITDEVKMHIAAGLDADTLRDLLADKEVPYDDNESDEKEIARLTAEVARINAENRRLTDEALTDIESLEAAERERDEARAEVARLTSSNKAHRKAEVAASNEIERLIAENQRMTEELNATREGAIRWHNECMQKYANNCGLLAERELAALRAAVREWFGMSSHQSAGRLLRAWLASWKSPHAEALRRACE